MEKENTKEINLLDLILIFFNWIKKLFINIFKIFGKTIQLNFKYIYIGIILLVISISVALFFSSSKRKIYKAETTVLLHGPSVNSLKMILEPLEKASNFDEKTSLSTILSISDDAAKSVYKIEDYYIIDFGGDSIPDMIDYKKKHNMKDTLDVLMYDRLQLAVFSRDISTIDIVEESILNYLNSHPTLVNINSVKHAELLGKLHSIEKEIERIDSMASITYFEKNDPRISFEGNRLLVGNLTKQIFSKHLMELHDYKMELEVELIDYEKPVSFLNNLVVNPVAINNRIKLLVFALIAAYLSSTLICLIIDSRKKIFKYLKQE